MDVPNIHSCLQMSSENEALKKKVHRLKREKQIVEGKLKTLEEKAKVAYFMKEYVTSRDVFVQTEASRGGPSSGYGQVKKVSQKSNEAVELEKTNKLLSMHSQLMKRYEKEVKTNVAHIETINSLNFRIVELERQCKKLEEGITDLKASKSKVEKPVPSEESSKSKITEDLKKCQKKCKKLEEQNKKYKSELKGLDVGFFEEVEDIKFALRQSAMLNKEYERTLRRLCAQFSVPYPHPERILDNS